jgi:3-mercaptopyruvate sulfurtransferase SseA
LLNGGWAAWLYSAGHLAYDEPDVKPRSPKLKRDSSLLVSQKRLSELQQAGGAQLVDAHGSSTAGTSRGAARPAIPLSWESVFDERQWAFKSVADIKGLFRSAGIDPGKPIIVCGESLGEAATLAFALELIGADQARVCFAGWDQ